MTNLTEHDAREIYLDHLDQQRTYLLSIPDTIQVMSPAVKHWRREVLKHLKLELMLLEARADDIRFEAECDLIYNHNPDLDYGIKAKAREKLEEITSKVRKMRWQMRLLRT